MALVAAREAGVGSAMIGMAAKASLVERVLLMHSAEEIYRAMLYPAGRHGPTE